MRKKIIRRNAPVIDHLEDVSPLLHRIYSARGVRSKAELDKGLEKLLPYESLSGIDEAVKCLLDALITKQHIMIIGDFDTDGATSTALAVSCLQKLGAAKVSYLVPNRFEFGYGLTPEIVEVAAKELPEILVTVDNGISSHEGVLRAKELGIKVIITDHHLPGSHLPDAEAIVNPNVLGDSFPSKNLSGVGVVFYVMMALRAKLRAIGWFEQQQIIEVKMADFLYLVALGTVADVVPLDANNRIMIHQGLSRIKANRIPPGIRALLNVAGKQIEQVSVSDLGFSLAPRLNAAGRLDDMSLGIACLLCENEEKAAKLAMELDALNKERRQLEASMQDQAINILANLQLATDLPLGICLFDETWHQGIIGILASRIKDKFHRPVFAFAIANNDEIKGSGRSIPGFNLKDALEAIATEYPDLLNKFGGHAMAAGVSLPKINLERFSQIFNEFLARNLSPESLEGIIYSDGELSASTINLETAEILQKAGPWGQGFPEPIFDGHFKVVKHRILKDKHLKLVLKSLDDFFMIDAMAFNIDSENFRLSEGDTLHIAYKLNINQYRGSCNVQLLIEYMECIPLPLKA